MTLSSPAATYNLSPCNVALVDELRRELGCRETTAWLLARRGVTADEARQLTAPLTDDQLASQLHDPFLLGDMAAAVERIRFAIDAHELIVVHGDYDADGVCSTTLLVEGLEALGADVRAFVPNRFTNGYGLAIEQVEHFARDGARLLIAVDCGITAVEPVAHARDLGVDVIVCDHHQPGAELPNAIICSTRPSDYPFPELCATAVAGKLVQALGGPSGAAQHELEAIATIADCMPLTDENRVLVRRGLAALRQSTRPGLRALAAGCGVRLHEIDTEAVAFKLAPRINAVGRIGDSERAYELLRADESTAPALAESLNATNDERRRIERAITDEAVQTIERWDSQRQAARVYVVHGNGWHEGVVGIVASRLVEQYGRPVVVIADGDPARGSARSIDGVDLHQALASCDDLLLRWGGHAQAGGVTIDPSCIGEFAERLRAWGETHVTDELLAPVDQLDAVALASEIDFAFVQELERLAPFGAGWQRPRLLLRGVTLDQMSTIGADRSHLRCVVQREGMSFPAIGFGLAEDATRIGPGTPVELAVTPSINRFRGIESLQLQIERIYATSSVSATPSANARPVERQARIRGRDIIDAARRPAGSPLDGVSVRDLPQLTALLAGARAVDLRHRSAAADLVAQVVAAVPRVTVVVADVERRSQLVRASTGLLPVRSVTVSEHDPPQHRSVIVENLRATSHEDVRSLLLIDQWSLDELLHPIAQWSSAIVVWDPLMTAMSVTALAGVADDVPTFLVHSARDERFTLDALSAQLDVRANLADYWRLLAHPGSMTDEALDRALFGDEMLRRSPTALVHGLRTLLDRDVLTWRADGSLGRATPEHVPSRN